MLVFGTGSPGHQPPGSQYNARHRVNHTNQWKQVGKLVIHLYKCGEKDGFSEKEPVGISPFFNIRIIQRYQQTKLSPPGFIQIPKLCLICK